MGFFSRNRAREADTKKSSDHVPETESEMKSAQNELKARQELDNITEKIQIVKEEYSTVVDNLMSVKKEICQKKTELDVIKREYDVIVDKIKKAREVRDSKTVSEFNKTQGELLSVMQKLKDTRNEHDEIKKQITEEQSTLYGIRKQQIEYEKELDEASSRLYNAKEELAKKDRFQDTGILTLKEKEHMQRDASNQKSSAGVIEAASAVVGSLKSKLNMAQKEMEALQLLLEKERSAHKKTERELERLWRQLGQ